jgi:hypothetical protein
VGLLVGLACVNFLYAAIDRGIIQGTVTDEQGATVPGAKVIVRNVDTNVEQNLVANSQGFYLAPELVPGKYLVSMEAPGFSRLEISNISVLAGITTTVDGRLSIGAVSEHVEVSAQPTLIESAPSNFTTPLERRYIEDIPLQGRDIQMLTQLIPGVTQSTGPSGSIFGFNSQFGGFPDPQHLVGSGISANGGQGGANAWYLDGSLNAALGAENIVVNPSPDAVSEFNVVDNGLAAEWGRTSGAVLNVVLKSGTNSVHGDAYDFNRNSFFNATNPFSRRDASGKTFLDPRVNWNNFGGTLGGPVYLPHLYNGKNRTFFFVSYDISLLHENKPTILTVPLPNQKHGDFRGDPRFAAVCDPAGGVTNCLYDPYSTTGPDAKGEFHRTPFPTPVIPADRIDPLAAFYLSSYPDPNFLDPLQQGPSGCKNTCNNYLGAVGSSLNTHNFSAKIDHQFSNKHKLFGEWLFNPSYYSNFRYPWNGPTAQTQTGIAGAQPYRVRNQIVALGLTSTFSPSLVNEVRGMFSRQSIVASPNVDSVTNNSDVLKHVEGLNFILFAPYQIVPRIRVGGVGSFGPAAWQNGIHGTEAYTFIDNMTKLLGKHTIKSGMMFRRENNWFLAAWGYNLGFGGGLTKDPVTGQGGAGLAQFLLGATDQGGSSTGTYHAPWQTSDYWGAYIQDDYRITSNFQLNIGLRYDVFGWFRERYDDLANFNFAGINPKVPYPGRLDYFGTSRHPGRNVFPAHKDDLGPRIAFAWSPFGSKTVVRGGFGLIYSNGFNATIGSGNGSESVPAFANPVSYQGDFTGQRPVFRLSDGAPNLSLPAADFAKKNDEQFLGTGPGGFLPGSKDPYVIQWSLNIQRELPGDMALSLGYVGTHGLHLYGDEYRDLGHVPTSVRLKLRNNINNPIPTDPALGAIYGCGIMCPASLILKPYPQYASAPVNISPDGFNRYNSFQMKLEKRYSQGLNFILAYTFQKNLESPNSGSILGNTATPSTLARTVGRTSFIPGASSGGASDGFTAASAEDPDNRRRYTALAPDDIPQVLNLAVTYELPVGKGKPLLNKAGAGEKIFGGWKLIQNWNIQSGVPLVFSAPCNGISCRPNLIGDPSRGRSSKSRAQLEDQWFDPAAFEAPFGSDPAVVRAVSTGVNPDGSPLDFNTLDAWWRFGNIGLRPPTGRTPGFWNADFTLTKNLHFTETRYLQIRWDVFNALNHQNLGVPNANWCLPPNPDGSVDAVHQFGCQFGKITNIQTDPRAMEFGLKFFW